MTLQATDYLITGSVDGHLKFWKKKPEGVEFVKHFRAHKGAIAGETAAWHAWTSSACPRSDERVQGVSHCCCLVKVLHSQAFVLIC